MSKANAKILQGDNGPPRRRRKGGRKALPELGPDPVSTAFEASAYYRAAPPELPDDLPRLWERLTGKRFSADDHVLYERLRAFFGVVDVDVTKRAPKRSERRSGMPEPVSTPAGRSMFDPFDLG